MQDLQKSKRVSWASDSNLCQVRLFLLEESPSLVGLDAQDHLQAKKTLSGLHFNGSVADDNLPPGFEGFNRAVQLKNKLAQIPIVQWQRPPKFILDVAWQVVNGEESKEMEIQNQREMRVLEAIYPRQSAIPPNPAVSPDVENVDLDDRTAPLIPITPIEEEDFSADTSADYAIATTSNPSSLANETSCPLSRNTSPTIDSATLAARGVGSGQQDVLKIALTTIAKSNEQIDHDLLVKILSNPTLLQQIVNNQGTSSGAQCVATNPMEGTQAVSSVPQFTKVETGSVSSAIISNGSAYPYPNGTGPMSHQLSALPVSGLPQVPTIQSGSVPLVKDLNYYKNLIQQHGGDRSTETPHSNTVHHPGINQDPSDNSKPRDTKTKIMKPCIYFNSSKGCRNGANCVYQHDVSLLQHVGNIPEMQSAKRMKMDREIGGSQSYT